MAAKKPAAHAARSLFVLAERQIVGLYDAGVMSPAVMHHVIAAYADSGIDWSDDGTLRTVDGHTVQEAVVLVMMPGRALRHARKDFMSVVAHLAGGEAPADDEVDKDKDGEELLSQLGGETSLHPKTRAARKATQIAEPKRAAFNPLVGARAVRGRGER
jgi:hypothetical protein